MDCMDYWRYANIVKICEHASYTKVIYFFGDLGARSFYRNVQLKAQEMETRKMHDNNRDSKNTFQEMTLWVKQESIVKYMLPRWRS